MDLEMSAHDRIVDHPRPLSIRYLYMVTVNLIPNVSTSPTLLRPSCPNRPINTAWLPLLVNLRRRSRFPRQVFQHRGLKELRDFSNR